MIDFQVIDPYDFHKLNEANKKKYIQTVIEEIEKSDNAVLKKMENIVKRYVKHYKNDFYIYDLFMLKKYKEPFLWMIRDTGTDLIPLHHLKGTLVDFYNYVKYSNERFYYYNGKTLKKVTFNEMEKIADQYKKNYWLVIG